MRNIAGLALISSLLFSNGELAPLRSSQNIENNLYSIQVISVEDEASVTDTFMSKVKSVSMPYVKKAMGKQCKIFVGSFHTHAEALIHLPKVRSMVSNEAFVIKQRQDYGLAPQQKMQQAMIIAQARTLKKLKEDENIVTEKILTAMEPIKSDMSEGTMPDKVVEKTPIVQKPAAMRLKSPHRPKEEASKEEEAFCKTTKKALRESEIAEAIAFYKASSYYSFKEQ